MFELSEQNVVAYLRAADRVSAGEVLVKSLSGGIANVVLQIFDIDAGPRLGTDLRTQGQIKSGKPDTRMNRGNCFVLKQPLPKFRTAAEWLVDIERVKVEKDCMELLAVLLPARSVPNMLWFDDPNYILAMSCAPTDAVLWKKELLSGRTTVDAAIHAGMLMAIMHSATHNDPAIQKRYGDPKFFIEQRIDPYLLATADKHPTIAVSLRALAQRLLQANYCLIHGDFSPKNIFLVPELVDPAIAVAGARPTAISHLLLLDFEVAYYGHPAFDVATLINHLLLKGFLHRGNWRPFMLLADNFWQTYRHTAAPALVRAADAMAGHLLGALMLARIDGKSPAEYLTDLPELQQKIRDAAVDLLAQHDASIERALDTASLHLSATS